METKGPYPMNPKYHSEEAPTRRCGPHMMLLTMLVCMPVLAEPPAAFLQRDTTTGTYPYAALKVMRGAAAAPSDSALQPCDELVFDSSQSVFKQVRVTTVRGGRNIVLNQERTSAVLSCNKVAQSEAWVQVWRAISGGERAAAVAGTRTSAAATRGTKLELPVLRAEMSNLAAGHRSLYLTWTGGKSPYRVTLKRAGADDILAEVKDIAATSTRLPVRDLKPGQYSIELFEKSGNGLRDDAVFLVDHKQLPGIPAAITNGKLSPDEAELLYIYYLEGLPAGRWVFEAMQRAAAIQGRLPAAAEWLQSYGSGN